MLLLGTTPRVVAARAAQNHETATATTTTTTTTVRTRAMRIPNGTTWRGGIEDDVEAAEEDDDDGRASEDSRANVDAIKQVSRRTRRRLSGGGSGGS